ncbi:MAG: hypothetical protein CV090_16425 [Nitrospira sp. WS238]|nr:hypothetical protein [Nitrospira sp. WS238]
MMTARYMNASSCTTLALLLCSSLASAETLQSGRHSLIHRPTIQNRPSATAESAPSPSRLVQDSVFPSSPPTSFRHKLIKRPTMSQLTVTRPPDTVLPNSAQAANGPPPTKP